MTEADEECPSRSDAKCPGARASWVESSMLRLGCQEEMGGVPPRWPDAAPGSSPGHTLEVAHCTGE